MPNGSFGGLHFLKHAGFFLDFVFERCFYAGGVDPEALYIVEFSAWLIKDVRDNVGGID
jgi:hypothetical protein